MYIIALFALDFLRKRKHVANFFPLSALYLETTTKKVSVKNTATTMQLEKEARQRSSVPAPSIHQLVVQRVYQRKSALRNKPATSTFQGVVGRGLLTFIRGFRDIRACARLSPRRPYFSTFTSWRNLFALAQDRVNGRPQASVIAPGGFGCKAPTRD